MYNTDSLNAIRILPPGDGTGGFLISTTHNIIRLDSVGNLVQTYDYITDTDPEYQGQASGAPDGDVNDYFALDVDPDGHTFWVANDKDIFHFNISTGNLIPIGPNNAMSIRLVANAITKKPQAISTVCIMNEYTAAHEICGNGIDDDGNGLIDENCKALEICSPDHPGDDNGDGLVDANDPECGAPAGTCATSGPTALSVGGICSRASAEGDQVTLSLPAPCSSFADCARWNMTYQIVGLNPNVPAEQLAPGEVAGLPPGLSLSSATGTVTGSPLYSIVANSPTSAPVVYVVKAQGTWIDPSDGVTATLAPVFRWSISNTNRNPLAIDDSAQVAAGKSVTIPVLANDLDPDGDAISISTFTQPTQGSVVLNGTQFQYTAPVGFNGQDTFTYTIQDSYTPAGTATATVHVSVNGPPNAANDTYSSGANVPLTVSANAANGLLKNDLDPLRLLLTVVLSSVTQPAHGAVTVSANGTFTYTPAANFTGTDTFTYQATDGILPSNLATVTINVAPPLTANNDSYSTFRNQSLAVSIPSGPLANDSNSTGVNCLSDLTHCVISLVTGPINGTLPVLNTNGGFTYVPATNFVGTDTFTYAISNGVSKSTPATVTITVNQSDIAPVAVNDIYSAIQGVALTVPAATGVISNDTDVDTPKSLLVATLVTQAAHGTVVLAATGSFTYTPTGTPFHGADTFTYKLNDGTLDSATPATVTINVDAPPVAANDAYTAPENTQLNVSVPSGVAANDSDPDTAFCTVPSTGCVNVVLLTSPAHGALILNFNGGFSYTPAQNYFGTDSFTYKLNDGLVDSNVATVTVTIAPVNQAPVATNQSASMNENTPVTITLSGADVDSVSLAFATLTSPAHGTLGLIAPSCSTVSAPPTTGANCTATDVYTLRRPTITALTRSTTRSTTAASIRRRRPCRWRSRQ